MFGEAPCLPFHSLLVRSMRQTSAYYAEAACMWLKIYYMYRSNVGCTFCRKGKTFGTEWSSQHPTTRRTCSPETDRQIKRVCGKTSANRLYFAATQPNSTDVCILSPSSYVPPFLFSSKCPLQVQKRKWASSKDSKSKQEAMRTRPIVERGNLNHGDQKFTVSTVMVNLITQDYCMLTVSYILG